MKEKRPERVTIRAHPWLLDTLLDDLYPYLERLEEAERSRITLLPDRTLAEEQYEIEIGHAPSLQLDPELERHGERGR
jgi:hypothetical protein